MIQPLTYQFGEYRLDRSARELRRNGAPVAVPTRVFDCLLYLIENRDRAIGRDELVAALWGRADVSDAQLGQIVLRARRAVGDDGNDQRFIRTMPKYGYRWTAETRVVAVDDAVRASAADSPDRVTADVSRPETAMPKPGAGPVRRRFTVQARWLVLVALAIVLASAAVVWWQRRPAAIRDDGLASAAIVVLPVDIAAGPEQDWVRLGGMDALASRLRAAGLRVPPSESVLAALQAGRAEGVDAETALRRATSTDLVVHATLATAPQGWRAELAAEPSAGSALHGTAEGREVLQTLRRAADDLLMRMGKLVPDQGATTSGLDETLQRANAAMLANQLDVARTILLAAPDLVRSEPELRYRLAQVDFRAGRLDDVESALQALLDDSAAAKDALLRARVLTGLGTVHLNLGHFADSERDFSAAIASLEGWQRPLERGQALGGRGAARAAQYRYDEAADDLGRARIELEQAGDRLGYARVDMADGELELQRGRPTAARPLLERAIAVFERFDAVNERLHSLAMLVDAERLQIDYAAALASSDRALELRQRVTDPQLRAQVVVSRATLLIDLGRYVEAAALLAELDHGAAPRDPQSLADIARVRAELALATGDAATAAREADVALSHLSDPHASAARAWVARLRARAQAMLGHAADARTAFAAALATETAEAREEIGYRLGAAELDAAEGRAADAEQAFSSALARADADGIPAHVVTVVSAYADWLLANGRADVAQSIVGRVAGWADRDFRCALLQLALFHQLGPASSWSAALGRTEKLAGEREIPPELRRPPAA